MEKDGAGPIPATFAAQLRCALGTAGTRGLVMISGLAVVASLVEVAGMGAVMQFMALVSDRSKLESPELIQFKNLTGIIQERELLVTVGLVVMVFLALGKLLTAFALWAQHRYVWGQDRKMAVNLLKSFLSRPYHWFLHQNSAHLNRHLNSRELTNHILTSVTEIVQVTILAIVILATLFWVDPGLALTSTVGVGIAYVIMAMATRRPIQRWAQEGYRVMNRRAMVGHEAVSAFKPILSSGCESYYLDKFNVVATRASKLAAWSGMVWDLPRYLLEAVALSLILALTLYFVVVGEMERLLPMLSLYAMAGYRLMPAVHRLLQAVNRIRSFRPELEAYLRFIQEYPLRDLTPPGEKLPLEDKLEFENLEFAYQDNPPILNGLNLTLKRGESIGLVGPTGSGKSTIIDLLMGLLTPCGGRLTVDGRELDQDTLRSWRCSVGYVPQAVFLKDDTIRQNVAFGVNADEIDEAALRRAIEAARLNELIDSLEKGVETEIGEHGVRISGGQRQRLGIARALYRDPEVLIFDEATSSLDSVTENEVMQAVKSLTGKKTVVLVAHRLVTVKDCDRIYLLEEGRVSAQGTYRELMESSPAFRALANESTRQ